MHIHFDLLAPVYDRILGSSKPDKLMRYINKNRKGSILEVGGGTGRFIKYFIPYYEEVYIIDPSVPMLKEAKHKFSNINLIRGYGDNLPFEDEKFDAVLIYDALHHFRNKIETIKEVYRVLKTNSQFILADIHPNHHWGIVTRILEKIVLMQSSFYEPKELILILEETGFKLENLFWLNKPTYAVITSKL